MQLTSSRDDHLNALYLSKAESRAKWSFIGVLFPPIGLFIAIIALLSVSKVKKYNPKEVRRIRITAVTSIILSLIVALSWLGVFDFLSSNQGNSNSAQSTNGTQERLDSTESSERLKLINKSEQVEIGSVMKFSTIDVKVNSVNQSKTISTSNPYAEAESAGEGAKFVIVNLTMTNTTTSPIYYRELVLIGDDGRDFGSFTAIGKIDNYMDGRDLIPGIPETGNAIYKVPENVQKVYLGGTILDKEDTGIFTILNLK